MPDRESVRLIARAEIQTAELTVLDSRFQFVHRAVGSVDIPLPPGTYLLQYKAGSHMGDVPVVLRPGAGSVEVPLPKISTRSPAPLAGSEAAGRYRTFAAQSSREIDNHHGQGGELLVMVRTATQDFRAGRSQDFLYEVQLLDDDMNVVMDMAKRGKRSPDGSAATCNVELAPGTYLLRYRTGESEMLEQSVVVSEGWQTQIFASSRPFAGGSLGANFPEAAVFVAPRGAGFDAENINFVRAESARIALAGSCDVVPEERLREVAAESKALRSSVPREQIGELLRSKFQNPMLGIYGAHLMLISGRPDWDVLREIVATLKTLVGNHPDVVALTLRPELQDIAEPCTFELPPMLFSSWKTIIARSAAQPDLVPATSYAAAVANRQWGSSAWLVWRPSARQPARAARPAATPPAHARVERGASETPQAIMLLHKYVLEQQRTIGPAQFVKQVAQNPAFTDTERAILVYAMTLVRQGRVFRGVSAPAANLVARASTYVHDILEQYPWADMITGGLQPDPFVQEQFAPTRLIQALGVPAAALEQAVGTLAQKIRNETQQRA